MPIALDDSCVRVVARGTAMDQVFVTFESDLSQARCLSHMSRGILDAPEEQHMYTNPDGESICRADHDLSAASIRADGKVQMSRGTNASNLARPNEFGQVELGVNAKACF